MVTLHTSFGDIVLKLNEEKAPKTVENFLTYCNEGFYDGTLFHRVIDGFMIQGGGMSSGLKEKSTHNPIKNEANNGLSNKVGTIAMARATEPHSACAQFFINVNDNHFLDFNAESVDGWGYCVFGEVIEGMEVVNKIKSVTTGNWRIHQDVPTEEILIKSVSVKSLTSA